ncbi:ankyrin repeat domain-containing protein [Rubripirellula sp.]|nr:ankyrin repeat domain-containing protein [Rubripirellula sp.]MDB4749851.1 ankyrin repeat domain-containing protein [Rubripirellula sp.]
MPSQQMLQLRYHVLVFVSALIGGLFPSHAECQETSQSSLADACEQRQFKLVANLLATKADINATQTDGMSALHWATFHDKPEIVSQLITAGASVGIPTKYGITPITLACQNGSARIVKLLLRHGADPNSVRDGRESVLATAARTGSVGLVAVLITAGADIDHTDQRGQTALMWASAEGNTEVVKFLLQHNANRSATLRSGFTAFAFAVRNGHPDVVKLFIDDQMDINQTLQEPNSSKGKDSAGISPLMLAIENGHFELALILVKAGADPNDARTGFAPLHALSWVRKPEIGDNQRGNPPPRGSGNLSSLAFAKALVEHGADVNLAKRSNGGGRLRISVKGATPFLCAASTADVAYMKLLLKLGAEPTATTSKRQNALMMAAGIDEGPNADGPGTAEEHFAAVNYLIELNKHDLDATDANGQSIMHAAAYKSLPNVIELFDQLGANIDVWNRKNKQGRTPLAIARGNRPGNFKPDFKTETAILKVMRKHGVVIPPPNHPKQEDWKKK